LFLVDWWNEKKMEQHHLLDPPDKGHPAYYGSCTGHVTPHPWSAALGAVERIQKRIDLPALRERVYTLLGVL
jgi:hypothetical protein